MNNLQAKKIFLYLFITLFGGSPLTWASTPTEALSCQISVLENKTNLPQAALWTHELKLNPTQTEIIQTYRLEKVEVLSAYAKFYSRYLLVGPGPIPPGIREKIIQRSSMTKDSIQVSLKRFAGHTGRVAGLALEFNIERGHYGSILLESERNGTHQSFQSPIKVDDDQNLVGPLSYSGTDSPPDSGANAAALSLFINCSVR